MISVIRIPFPSMEDYQTLRGQFRKFGAPFASNGALHCEPVQRLRPHLGFHQLVSTGPLALELAV